MCSLITYTKEDMLSILDEHCMGMSPPQSLPILTIDRVRNIKINEKSSMLWERNVNKEIINGFKSLGSDGQLKRAENKWEIKNKNILNVVNALLNKMTSETFVKLSKELCELHIKNSHVLKDIIHMIYDKATMEHSFCDIYTKLCLEIISNMGNWDFIKLVKSDNSYYWIIDVENDEEVSGPFDSLEECNYNGNNVVKYTEDFKLIRLNIDNSVIVKTYNCDNNFYISSDKLNNYNYNGPFESERNALEHARLNINFKRYLLNVCQREFVSELNMTEDTEEQFKLKHKKIGNIKLIGELYNSQVIKDEIIFSCLRKLLNDDTDLSIEQMCILLNVIGKTLYMKHREVVEQYFTSLKGIKFTMSSRIRFMIEDLIDFKKNNWIKPRQERGEKVNIMTDEVVHRKVKNMVEEFSINKNIDDVILYFEEIPMSSRSKFVEKIVDRSITDEKLIDDIIMIISRLNLKGMHVKEGFSPIWEFLDDIIIDSPNSPIIISKLLKLFIEKKYITTDWLVNKSKLHSMSDYPLCTKSNEILKLI